MVEGAWCRSYVDQEIRKSPESTFGLLGSSSPASSLVPKGGGAGSEVPPAIGRGREREKA